MQFSQQSLSSQAAAPVMPVNGHSNPQFAWQVSGTFVGTYNVEYTLDNIYDSTITPTWTSLPNANALTAPAGAFVVGTARGVRLNCTAYTSGTMTLKLLQGEAAG